MDRTPDGRPHRRGRDARVDAASRRVCQYCQCVEERRVRILFFLFCVFPARFLSIFLSFPHCIRTSATADRLADILPFLHTQALFRGHPPRFYIID